VALRSIVGSLLVALLAATPVFAQGHGHGLGKAPRTGTPPSSQQAPVAPAGAGVRAFGVWLDDASVMPPGSGWVSLSLGHWRTSLFHQTDVPTVDAGYGVWRRVQVGGTVPYYHASEIGGGPMTSGLGDVFLNSKIQLREPTDTHPVGFALIPVVEILGEAAPDGSRMHWALPGSIEIQQEHFRVYGTAGYFSRGALFASGALEVPVTDRVVAYGALTHSYSTKSDPLALSMGLNQQRSDVTGGVSCALTPSAIVFGSVGRTISRRDATSATLALNVGISLVFQRSEPKK
jgi:hypothetical protein